MKGDYEVFNALGRRKNKANSKPNKANRRTSGILSLPPAWPKCAEKGRFLEAGKDLKTAKTR
jgi:hypothetical protein